MSVAFTHVKPTAGTATLSCADTLCVELEEHVGKELKKFKVYWLGFWEGHGL